MSEDDARERADLLWEEYGSFLSRWDDLTLARWISQTLAQISGGIWRQSHPLIGTLRLAAMRAVDRGLHLSRIATVPHEYHPAECCGMPLVPIFTRDVMEQGLTCLFCGGKGLEITELDPESQRLLQRWAKAYGETHEVAHWPEERRKPSREYERLYNDAAMHAEKMLVQLATEVLPLFLDRFPAIIWEDQDECLDVRPDDILLRDGGSEPE